MNKLWKDYLQSLLIAIFLALVVRTFVLTGYKVPTISMSPTLIAGDFIFVYKLNLGIKIPLLEKKFSIKPPAVGDIVAFTFPDQPKVQYVKRVAGLEGDRIEIRKGILYRNGEKLLFPFETATKDIPSENNNKSMDGGGGKLADELNKSPEEFGPIVVPPNSAFLIGDNRLVSDDSRYWGTVPIEKMEGQVVMVWFSWTSESGIRWDRLMKIIH